MTASNVSPENLEDLTEENATAKEEKKPDRIRVVDLTPDERTKTLKFHKVVRFEFTTLEGEFLQGDFTIKRPTLMDTSAIGNKAADLRYDKPLSAISTATAQLQDWIATVSVCVVKAPDWWDLDNWYDDQFLLRLYQEVTVFWASFRKSIR